jgi:hypothetical protein
MLAQALGVVQNFGERNPSTNFARISEYGTVYSGIRDPIRGR